MFLFVQPSQVFFGMQTNSLKVPEIPVTQLFCMEAFGGGGGQGGQKNRKMGFFRTPQNCYFVMVKVPKTQVPLDGPIIYPEKVKRKCFL